MMDGCRQAARLDGSSRSPARLEGVSSPLGMPLVLLPLAAPNLLP